MDRLLLSAERHTNKGLSRSPYRPSHDDAFYQRCHGWKHPWFNHIGRSQDRTWNFSRKIAIFNTANPVLLRLRYW